MGQLIEVDHVLVGEVAVFDTDRSLSGQEGETFRSAEAARQSDTFPARLAAALFEVSASLTSVYVFSNTVSVRRFGGWDEDLLSTIGDTIRDSLLFYRD
ncbi:MAG: hypothetical protein F4Y75_05025 [Acidimicrobiia bacterium]|nr:hypothetical protein [bacterium]MXX65008.1 hypothetical protein [Acidimicrobiia bacterium]MCY3652800.1 hypothetical protein [bacterium]MDE0643314.1 hypothetical protein [bacterium]MXZ06859.1 hypothetical protein [Acidimicrobiia bacterium]